MATQSSTEEWRPINGWEAFEVSDRGRVRRVRRSQGGRIGVLKGGVTSRGYRHVTLRSKPKLGTFLVHRLVCGAFHGPPPFKGAQAAHWDGDKLNNHADNLRWATAGENAADNKRQGKILGRPKCSAAKRRAMCRARRLGLTYEQIARRFGTATMTAWRVVKDGVE